MHVHSTDPGRNNSLAWKLLRAIQFAFHSFILDDVAFVEHLLYFIRIPTLICTVHSMFEQRRPGEKFFTNLSSPCSVK